MPESDSNSPQQRVVSWLDRVITTLVLLASSTSWVVAAPSREYVPVPPFPLKAIGVSATQINLKWVETSYDRQANTGYRIERRLNENDGWVLAGTTSGFSFQDNELQPNTHYYYRVFGMGPGGISEGHSEASETTLAALPNVPTCLTQARAVQLTQNFCQNIGTPVTADGRAEYPAPNEYPDEPEHHWQPRWRVIFPGQAIVEIVDATGEIASYKNLALDRYMFDQRNRPLGDILSEAEALQRATVALRAAGLTEELSAPKASYVELVNPVKFGTRDWDVVWRRQFHGIPYAEGRVIVMLEAETGAVERLGTAFPSAPPARAVSSVSRDQAARVALTAVANVGLLNTTLESVQALVVAPNTFWQPGGSENIQVSGTAHMAWVCRFAMTDGGDRKYEVWVDTETGAILGGSTWTRRGGSRKPVPQVRAQTQSKPKVQDSPKPAVKSPPTAKASKSQKR